MKISKAQQRLLDIIKTYDDYAAYWDVINDWVNDDINPELAFRNINRTVEALLRTKRIKITDDGLFELL